MKLTMIMGAVASVLAIQNDVYRRSSVRHNKRDAYDLDPTTVSPYDDMYQHKKFDWGVAEGEPGSKGAWAKYHGTWVDMR